MTASTRLLARAPGSAWIPPRPGDPMAIDAGTFALVTLPTSPFWARRYIRHFLGSCRGIGADTADTAELLVSELVTNAVRFARRPSGTTVSRPRGCWPDISVGPAFRWGLLIEVFDTDANPPVLVDATEDAENGRGLLLVDALSEQWSYFFPPCGKVVYCFIEIPYAAAMTTKPPARAGLDLRVREKRDADLVLGPGAVRCRLACPPAHPAGRIPDLLSRAHHTGTEPGLPADRRADSPARRAMRIEPATATSRRASRIICGQLTLSLPTALTAIMRAGHFHEHRERNPCRRTH